MQVDRALRDPGPAGHVIEAGCGEAFLGKLGQGRGHDGLPPLNCAGGPGSRSGAFFGGTFLRPSVTHRPPLDINFG